MISETESTLQPEQLVQEAKAAYEMEEYEQAAQVFETAEKGFRAQGDALMAAEMANNRSVALLQAGQAEAALEAVRATDTVFAEANDRLRQAMALGNQAAALGALGQRAEAEAMYWESAQLLSDIGEKELRASVLQSISRLQMRSGRYLQAAASMESGIDQLENPSFSQRIIKKLLKIPSGMMNK